MVKNKYLNVPCVQYCILNRLTAQRDDSSEDQTDGANISSDVQKPCNPPVEIVRPSNAASTKAFVISDQKSAEGKIVSSKSSTPQSSSNIVEL